MERVAGVRWLADCSATAVAEALRVVAPELTGLPITMPGLVAKEDPTWWSSSAVIGERFVAKFAWSRPAALRVAHEIEILRVLASEPRVPYLPEVVASSLDPLLLVTRRVPGASLFNVVNAIDRDRAGRQLARFLAALHRPETRRRAEGALGGIAEAQHGSQHPVSTRELRDRLGPWVRPDQHPVVMRWCDWVDAVLAPPRPSVLVHADLHGDNQVWDHDQLRVVVDFETVCVAEREYDLRAFPGTGPGVELLTATLRHYQQLTGQELAVDRVMAWHLRTVLDDVLWRSEAGVPLPDHRAPAAWVDDLSVRLSELGVQPCRLQ